MEIDKKNYSNDAICKLEYTDGSIEKSNFNFYLKSLNTEVFFDFNIQKKSYQSHHLQKIHTKNSNVFISIDWQGKNFCRWSNKRN